MEYYKYRKKVYIVKSYLKLLILREIVAKDINREDKKLKISKILLLLL